MQIAETEIARLLRMHENIRKAQQKYRKTHPEVMNRYATEYYHRHKEDPEFIQKRRERSLANYYRKKASGASNDAPCREDSQPKTGPKAP